MAQQEPRGFDRLYRDPHGRGPEDPGFVAPRPTGYASYLGRDGHPLDPAYEDEQGRRPGQPGFVPPPPPYCCPKDGGRR